MALKSLRGVLRVCDEVASALAQRRPVVALESTIISHGMPYPQNLQTALEVERIVRQHGAVPATVALIDGHVHVGLDPATLETLASATGVRKTSRRDLAVVLASRGLGATTVSATMIAAHAAGIPLFVTGGLGGVHRGATTTMDISADITELGRTPIGVVCAGVKSILDIGLTLEALETQGVTVVTVGSDPEFPAFFSPRSGFKSTDAIPTAEGCARILQANRELQLSSGIVFAVPIPAEHAYQAAEIEKHVQQALKDAEAAQIAGKDVTPFVLSRVNKLTAGKSLETNIALVKHNAAFGAQIAVEHSRLVAEPRVPLFASAPVPSPIKVPKVAVVGGVVLDTTARLLRPLEMCTTNYGRVSQALGGVGRNIAECLHRLGAQPLLFSCIGADPFGKVVASSLTAIGMDTAQLTVVDGQRTAAYNAILGTEGDLEFAVGDMDVFDRLDVRFVERAGPTLDGAAIICVDGNVVTDGLRALTARARERRIPVWMDTTSTTKAHKALDPGVLPNLTFISPNIPEMQAIAERVLGQQLRLETVEEVRTCVTQTSAALRRRHGQVPYFIVKMGPLGVLAQRFPDLGRLSSTTAADWEAQWVHFPITRPGQQPLQIVSVTGAGDSFCGGTVAALLRGHSFYNCIRSGLVAARHSLRSTSPVGETLTPSCIDVAHLDDPAPGQPSN